jgi:hypothetical protein
VAKVSDPSKLSKSLERLVELAKSAKRLLSPISPTGPLQGFAGVVLRPLKIGIGTSLQVSFCPALRTNPREPEKPQ